MKVLSCVLLSGLLLATSSAAAAETSLGIEGLKLTLDEQGAITRVRAGEVTAGGHPQDGGLWVREVPNGELVLVPLSLGKAPGKGLAAAGLRVAARMEARSDHLLVTGAVEDLQGADRAVDLVFRLPLAEAHWWSRISEVLGPDDAVPVVRQSREKLPPGAAVLEVVEKDGLKQNILPVACVTEGQSRAGMALAIPPDFPCVFRFAYLREPGCLELCLPLGLSPAASGPWKSRAEFRFLVMAADGKWGLRDALRQYYVLFPQSFARRTRSSGLWLFNIKSLAQVPDPESYAFWEGPHLGELAQAESHHIETYPYIIVGQRELTYLKEPAKGYEDVVAMLNHEPVASKPRRWKWEEVRAWVQQCGLQDPHGRWVYNVRNTNWGGNSITFPVNPSPLLPTIEGRPTVAGSTLAEVERLIAEHPSLSGIYVDSLASWGSFSNYRHEHFAATRAPLTHDPAGRVSVPNWMPHIDFLRELRGRIAPRLVFGNGIRPGRAFPAFVCDVLGVECSTGDTTHRRNLDFYRAVAGAKLFLGLFYYPQDEDSSRRSGSLRAAIRGPGLIAGSERRALGTAKEA